MFVLPVWLSVALAADPAPVGTAPVVGPPAPVAPPAPPPIPEKPGTGPCPKAAAIVLPDGTRPLPQRAFLFGSSSMQSGFGPLLEAALEQGGITEVRREGMISSGLARQEFMNWPARLSEVVLEFDPQLVVVELGGNDAQSLADPTGRRVAAWADTATWEAAYTERLRQITAIGGARGATVVFVGVAHPREPAYAKSMCRVSGVQGTYAASSAGMAWYVPLWDITSNQDGSYKDRFVGASGRSHAIRGGDGTHFASYGAAWAAAVVAERILGRFDAPPPAPAPDPAVASP